MGKIKILPERLIEKIAAGEVVERPASVVKELVENSLDAKAASVRVEVSDGGKKAIVVADDGEGIARDDLKPSLMSHATSKLESEEDLWKLHSFGFRGEALSSVGAISKVKISSKQQGSLEGWQVESLGGEISDVNPVGCAKGTRIEVRELYFNTPARLKFMRSRGVEFGHIADVVERLALVNPLVRFELVHDDKNILLLPAVKIVGERILSIIDSALRPDIVDMKEAGDGIGLEGLLSREKFFSTGRYFYIYVNGRPISDRMLRHAVTAGFGERLGRNQYPVAMINLLLEPSKVDVNVHPTKREVRFQDQAMVHDFVMSAVRKVVTPFPLPRGERVITESIHAGINKMDRHALRARDDVGPQQRIDVGGDPLPCPVLRGVDPLERANTQVRPYKKNLDSSLPSIEDSQTVQLIGALNKTYILCEGGDGQLLLIDQHAAHERIGFDELKRQRLAGLVERQQLLFPLQVDLSGKEFSIIIENKERLNEVGLEIEPFGERTLLIKSVPAIIAQSSVEGLIHKLADDISEMDTSLADEEVFDKIFATIACHGQVRGGDELKREEMDRLIKDVISKKVESCPHGRPVMVKVDKREIEKWFKR